jgi:exodeoxyribonuclease VII large subunit
MWVVINTWCAEIIRQSDKLFTRSKQSVSDARLLVTSDFNSLLSTSKSVTTRQRQQAVQYNESIRLDAFKAVQLARREVTARNFEIDRFSQTNIDQARQVVVQHFNKLQLTVTRAVAGQKNHIHHEWHGLRNSVFTQIQVAKQNTYQDFTSVVTSAKRHASASKVEVINHWCETQKSAYNVLDKAKDKVENGFKIIEVYDPQKTLERGYSIIYSNNGRVVKEIGATESGQIITVRMKDGSFAAKRV